MSTSDRINTASAERNTELGDPAAFPHERTSLTDAAEKRDAPVEHGEDWTGNTGDVLDHQKEQAMENNPGGTSTPCQINAASAQGNSKLRAAKPDRDDGGCYLGQEQPIAACSGKSHSGLGEELSSPGKEAANEMNGPEAEHPPGLPDITNCSFEGIITIFHEMGAITDDGTIKVDAQILKDSLGEDKARKLVQFFNHKATSMDLVITEGVWGFNEGRTTTRKQKWEEIPEWCMALLRDLVVALSRFTEMSEKWKGACEDTCGILQDTLNNVDATMQKQNEIHSAAMNGMKEDFLRARVAHEEMLQKVWNVDNAPAEAERENSEDEQKSSDQSQSGSSNSWLRRVLEKFETPNGTPSKQTRHEQPGNNNGAGAVQKTSGMFDTNGSAVSMAEIQMSREARYNWCKHGGNARRGGSLYRMLRRVVLV
ncbi:uncharacterized protein LOC144148636 [Haemaphysalis longicornis]